jgi:hypothetical protein
MDSKRGIGRFFGWTRPQHAPEEPDAADVGTAFGMELSLAPDPPPSAENPLESSQGARTPAVGSKTKRGYT